MILKEKALGLVSWHPSAKHLEKESVGIPLFLTEQAERERRGFSRSHSGTLRRARARLPSHCPVQRPQLRVAKVHAQSHIPVASSYTDKDTEDQKGQGPQ